MNLKESKYTLPVIAVIAMPVIFWLFIIVKFAADVPWFDDFDPFPDFLRRWIQAEGFIEKVRLIFQPNNEHRMIWGKLITLCYYKLTDTLDFRFIQISSSFFTLGVFILFFKSLKDARIPLVYLIPVPFFLFHLQYYGTYLWSICGMQHQPVIFFVALTSWLLGRKRFGAAVVAAVCANFAMGNGIFVWVSGFAILLFSGKPRQLVVWSILGAANILLYFHGMSPQGNETSLAFLAENPMLSFIGFFTFLGGLFDLSPDRNIQFRNIATFIAGFLTGTYAIWWILRTIFQKPETSRKTTGIQILTCFIIGILVFILSNALVIALLRPRFGMEVMLASNYKIYPGLFFAAVYISILLFRKPTAGIWKSGLSLALALWLGGFFIYLPTVRERYFYFKINAYNQRHNQFGLGFEPGSEAAAYIDGLIDFLDDRGVYQLPQDVGESVKFIAQNQPTGFSYQSTIQHNAHGWQIHIPDYPVPYLNQKMRFFYVRSDQKTYLFKVDQNLNQSRNFLKKYDKGTVLNIPEAVLQKGTYQVGIYDEKQKNHSVLGEINVDQGQRQK